MISPILVPRAHDPSAGRDWALWGREWIANLVLRAHVPFGQREGADSRNIWWRSRVVR